MGRKKEKEKKLQAGCRTYLPLYLDLFFFFFSFFLFEFFPFFFLRRPSFFMRFRGISYLSRQPFSNIVWAVLNVCSFSFPDCRDVLVIGKRLAKERDEMCRQLGRLYEDVTSLHQALLFELRTLHRDLAGVRDRVTSSRKAGEIAEYVIQKFTFRNDLLMFHSFCPAAIWTKAWPSWRLCTTSGRASSAVGSRAVWPTWNIVSCWPRTAGNGSERPAPPSTALVRSDLTNCSGTTTRNGNSQ